MPDMKLIVQIPAYNEESTIGRTLLDIPKKIEGVTVVETLVIDDGSTDKTVEAAKKAGASHIVQLKNHRGLSAAFVAGIDAALHLGADIIVNTDADNQYAGADIPKLIAPIVKGAAEVVIGDRETARSPHMTPLKRFLQRLGSWTVGRASGVRIGDVTSGFRAFTREAAMQINVFNPFTYTLETIIQAGNRNLGVQSVTVRTNAPTRPSRLYSGLLTYVRKSIATIIRVYAVYRPLKTFFFIGCVLLLVGIIIGLRFVVDFLLGDRGGHVQSLILASVFLITGFHTLLIAMLADLIAVNRRLSEEVLIRLRRLESPRSEKRGALPERVRRERPARRERGPVRPAVAGQEPQTQWVWLLDEEKPPERDLVAAPEVPAVVPRAPSRPEASSPRRRRRRRGGGGMRQHPELPGNRGKHLESTEPGDEGQ